MDSYAAGVNGCHAFRYAIEVQEKNILTWIFNSLSPSEISARADNDNHQH